MNRGSILVLGAAHLDIAGDYGCELSDHVDKPGEITYSVGGTGYNLAVSLAREGLPVRLATVLREGSLITPIILARLQRFGVDTSAIDVRASARESGFLAHREDGRLVSAVTSTTLDDYAPSESLLKDWLGSCSLIVADCNLNTILLRRIAENAGELRTSLFLAAVSQAKVMKMSLLSRMLCGKLPVTLSAMTEAEALAVGIEVNRLDDAAVRSRACALVGAHHVVVTRGEAGYLRWNVEGDFQSYPPPLLERLTTATGAGDALFAALIASRYRLGWLDWLDINRSIARMVPEALAARGATADSTAAPEELSVIPRSELEALRNQEHDRFIRAFGEPVNILGKQDVLGDALTLVSVLIALFALAFKVL